MRTLLALFMLLPCLATAGERSVEDIWREAQRRNRVHDSVQTVRMVLVSRRGSERVRDLEMHVRADEGDVVRSYTRFDSPADVAGTQLVLVDVPGKEDVQLLYLPALERVSRIAGRARSRSFLGSDFRFEDFEPDTGDGEHVLVEETAEHWVIDSTDTGSYERIRSWIDKSDNLPRRVRYFDEGEAVRELSIEAVEQHQGVPVPMLTIMRDLERGTATRLEVVRVRVEVPEEELPDAMFTAAWLEQHG